MTASWLRQLGWDDAVVLAGGVAAAEAAGIALTTGRVARVSVPPVPTIKISTLADRLAAEPDTITVLDVGTSIKYRNKGHIPGAWWGVRSRLDQAKAAIGEVTTLVVTSTDGLLAKLAAADAAAYWPDAEILALAGGNKGWRHGGHDMEPGFTRPTTDPDDVWYKPYDHDDGNAEQHMQDYLTWEIALGDQIRRDKTVSFPSFD
jgi:3-mercaptopyruvate sulfurtransferase SseA